MNTTSYLDLIGVAKLPPRTVPFDPGYDAGTVREHLRQSAHLMAGLKISMACWQVADESITREKIDACKQYGVKTSAGGGPLEVAAYFDVVRDYLRLCADIGLDRIEAGEGFIRNGLNPHDIVAMAADLGLEVQYELGEKHGGAFTKEAVDMLLREGHEWLEAGAKQLVIEARESAQGVGLFDETGEFNESLARRFMESFGEELAVYEAPIKSSQFALLDFFGPRAYLGNIRLEELLRVEIYRRGLHSDAFRRDNLRPSGPQHVELREGVR